MGGVMNDSLNWLMHTLGASPAPRDSNAHLRAAEAAFLSSLLKARENVIADGLEVLLSLQSRTIGDDPHFGLPTQRRSA